MESRLEELIATWHGGALSPPEQAELVALVGASEEGVRMAARDRLIDRWLSESQKPALDSNVILRAIAEPPGVLAARTMAELERREAEGGPHKEGFGLRWLREWWLRSAAAAAAMVATAVGLYFGFRDRFAPRVEIGHFAAVVGSPKVAHFGQRSTLHASLSSTVCLGDRIETGDADKTEIQFTDGTTLRLSFNTTLEIPSPKSIGRPKEIKLLLGQVWAKVQKTTNQSQFAVQTPVATAAVKGTEFGLRLRKAAASGLRVPLTAILTVKEGVVEFSNPFGKVEATDLTESVATGTAAPTVPRRVSSLKTYWIKPKYALVETTSRPSLPEAGHRLAYRGGWAGLDAADAAIGGAAQGANAVTPAQQVRVVRVERNSPAETAGMRVGDVILAINGRAITNAWQVEAAIFEQPGTSTTLTLAGEPAPRVVTLTSSAAPDAPPLPPLSRAAFTAVEAASRLLLEHRDNEGQRALDQLLGTEAAAAAHNNLGLLYETEDDLAQAIAHYQAAVRAAPAAALYHFNYGLALQNIGNLERAAEELEIATSLAPSWAEAFQVLAEICSPLDRHEDALRAVDAALRLRPQSPDVWLSRGTVLAHQNRTEEARQAFTKALELEPTYAAACRKLGDLYHHEDQLDEAERLLRRAVEIDPSDVGALSTLGNIYGSQGRFAEAVQTLLEVIRRDPAGALAYSNLGYLYRRHGQTAQAERMYLKAIELDPDSPIPYTNLGELYRRLGRLDEAERMLRTGIDLDPQNVTAINNLGGLYHYNRHQYDQAEKIYRRVIEMDPTYPYPFSNLGNLLLDRGNLDEAEKMYRKAIELIGDKPEAAITWARLGQLDEKRGEPGAAIEAYHKALSLQPDLAEAKAALQRLGQ
jgi:tetratricopeptide (TPR) repeat protein